MKQDVRWKQSFENYDRAFNLLHSALISRPLDEFSDLELEGLIQRFEYSFELAWKTMKDFLEDSGIQIVPVTPKTVIKANPGESWGRSSIAAVASSQLLLLKNVPTFILPTGRGQPVRAVLVVAFRDLFFIKAI